MRPSASSLHRLVGQVELVLDLAHDLLQDVFERDDALRRAVLVDDDGHVLLDRRKSWSSAARSFVSGTTCAGRSSDSTSTSSNPPVGVDRAHEVADVEDADDGVERVAGRRDSA